MDATLSDEALLKLLATEQDFLPRAVVDEIVRRGERLSPALLRMVEDREAWDRPAPSCYAPVHATFLLACLQPPRVPSGHYCEITFLG